MKKILVITEKPSIAKIIKPTVENKWPGDMVTILAAPPYNQQPLLPDGDPVDSCFFGDTKYYLGEGMLYTPGTDKFQIVDVSKYDITPFDEIIFAMDPDHSSVMAFKYIIENKFDTEKFLSINAAKLVSWDEGSVALAFYNMEPMSKAFQAEINYGEVKRYFDWHWAANSLKTLSPVLKSVNADVDDFVLSKYTLLMLHYIEGNPEKSESALHDAMHGWRLPSGVVTQIGSAASRAEIIGHLIRLDLVDISKDGNRQLLTINETGKRVLDLTSKRMNDPFMPVRIAEWGNEGLSASAPEIDAYLAAMFNDQIAMNKQLDNKAAVRAPF